MANTVKVKHVVKHINEHMVLSSITVIKGLTIKVKKDQGENGGKSLG